MVRSQTLPCWHWAASFISWEENLAGGGGHTGFSWRSTRTYIFIEDHFKKKLFQNRYRYHRKIVHICVSFISKNWLGTFHPRKRLLFSLRSKINPWLKHDGKGCDKGGKLERGKKRLLASCFSWTGSLWGGCHTIFHWEANKT